MTIFNFGKTIYQTMQRLPESSQLRRQIEAAVERHTRWQPFGSHYGEEELWTLYAVQSGVSSLIEEDNTRGKGLTDLVEYFQLLGGMPDGTGQPEMCVVSGHAHLRFDSVYPMKREFVGDEWHRIIAFNKDNDLHHPPDKRNVRRLKTFFPGTLVSMRFDLNPVYLAHLANPSEQP